MPPKSVANFTVFETPRNDKSPSIIYSPSFIFENDVALNLISGNCATSKKSGLNKWASLSEFPVDKELISPVNSIFAFSKVSLSYSNEASNFENLPETLVNIMCLTLNPISECVGSIAHLVIAIVFIIYLNYCVI